MSITKINLIVQSFQQMNLSLLDVLLDDNKVYNETTKEIFLEKIEEVFNTFKRYNCTELIPHIGFCSGKHKWCKSGVQNCSGYTFRGKNSELYISFAFKTDEIVKFDLSLCCSMQNIDFDGDITFELGYKIYEDEKVNFLPTNEYIENTIYCLNILEDLNDYKTQIMDFEFCIYWLDKYRNLKKSFYDYNVSLYNFKLFDKLLSIYNSLDSLYNVLKYVDIVKVACAEYENITNVFSRLSNNYENINIENIDELNTWNDKYYKLSHNKFGLDIKNCNVSFNDIDKTDFIFIKDYKISFKELRFIIRFEYYFFDCERILQNSNV